MVSREGNFLHSFYEEWAAAAGDVGKLVCKNQLFRHQNPLNPRFITSHEPARGGARGGSKPPAESGGVQEPRREVTKTVADVDDGAGNFPGEMTKLDSE